VSPGSQNASTGPSASFIELWKRAPGYVPELALKAGDPGRAIMAVAARFWEILKAGSAAVPDRSRLGFLDMLGTSLLPAQAARAALVFSLVDGSPVDITLASGSQVAAVPAPVAMLPGATTSSQPVTSDPVVFATEQSITLCRAKVAVLYSVDPSQDRFADHSASLTTGFSLFEGLGPAEHAIYLGHDQLFAIAGSVTILLGMTLDTPAGTPLDTTWEYLSDRGWLPFECSAEDDRTSGLQRDGQIVLRRAAGPNAKQATLIPGHTSFWLRGKLMTALPPQDRSNGAVLPVFNDIRASVQLARTSLSPDAACCDARGLDTSKEFFPFGSLPATLSAFYLANREAFAHRGATVSLIVTLAQTGQPSTNPQLKVRWEYSSANGWRQLSHGDSDPSAVEYEFLYKDTITFVAPDDWSETSVNGTKNFWLRAVIAQGDYGQPIGMSVTDGVVTAVAASLHAPIVETLTLAYSYRTDPTPLDHCIAHNNFLFTDNTDACRWPDQVFAPFEVVSDRTATVHLGFDGLLPAGLVSLYADIAAEDGTAVVDDTSPFVWEYQSANGWAQLSVIDETAGFTRYGLLQFVGPPDAVATDGLGGNNVHRIRARLKDGVEPVARPVGGLWLNAVWASNSVQYDREPLGAGGGNPDETFQTRHTPVLDGEIVEVQEWSGRGEYWRTFVQGVPEADLRFERDPASNDVTAVWVHWQGRPHLHDSLPDSRHYTIERVAGTVRFGDGTHGLVPPAGLPIVVTYRSDGGLGGNVAAGTISQLRTAASFVAGVANPNAAAGGASAESTASAVERGSQCLRHRMRAVSTTDYEWLAREASPQVARARCHPLTGPDVFAQRGWVSVSIVPFSDDPQPDPSIELRTRVGQFIREHAPATLADRIRVLRPEYCPVSVMAELVPELADTVAALEAAIRARLETFLHPLSGGPLGLGWAFGQTLHLSQVARVLAATDGVACVRSIRLDVAGRICPAAVPVAAQELLASGNHQFKWILGGS
jgi:uncharacterized phage protein gp47/JayE